MTSNLQKNLKKLRQKTEIIPKIISQQKTIDMPVYMMDLNDEIDGNEVAEICHFYQTPEYKEKNTQSVYAWRSEYHSVMNNKMPKFDPLLDTVTKKIKLIWKSYYSFKIDHYWFAIYQNGDSSLQHDHGTVDLACVYYATCPDKSAPLIIPSINGDVTFHPKQGSLLIFPGNCSHRVPKSDHKGERIIVAMNILRDSIIADTKLEGKGW